MKSQVRIDKSASRNIARLLALLQLVNQAKCLRSTSGLPVCGRQQLDGARTTVRKRSRFLEYWDRFVRLALSDEYESKNPAGECIVRVHGQHAVQFSNGLVIATGLEQDPTDL